MIPARRTVLTIATVMVWVAAYAAWTADWMVDPMPHLLARSLRRVPMCLFGMACCRVMAMLLDRLAARPWRWRLLTALALSFVASALYAALNTLVFYVIVPLWGSTSLAETLQLAVTVAWVFLAWCALYFAIAADAEARDSRLRLAAAREAGLRARHQALAQQVNPHFLFNALNAVSGLILEGAPAKAERVTMALAGLLRRSLDSDGRERVTLGEELDAVHRYIEIEQMRFEDRFRLVEDVPAGVRQFLVPALILQPLVENAVKHGVARSSRPVTVTIAALACGGRLEISVGDDAEPDVETSSPTASGIGEANVRERLALLWGPAAGLACGREDRGYVARITLPA
jgi:two-component system LytT family sensor kinase